MYGFMLMCIFCLSAELCLNWLENPEYLGHWHFVILYLCGVLSRVSQKVKYEELDEGELKKRREARKVEQASNPHYLKDSRKKKLKDLAAENEAMVDGIPVAKIDLNVPLHIPG